MVIARGSDIRNHSAFVPPAHPGSDDWAEIESSKGQTKWMQPKRGVKVAESISRVLRDYFL